MILSKLESDPYDVIHEKNKSDLQLILDSVCKNVISGSISVKDKDKTVEQITGIKSNLPELISMTKKPRWNTYTHLIAKEAKKYGNLLVTGDGADELFAGYTFRYKKFLQLLKPHDTWLSKAKKYLECHNRDWVPNQKLLFDGSIKFNWKTIYSYLKPYFQNKMHPLNQVLLADYNGKLTYDFIPTSNHILKYYRISGGPIFLDKKIISFAMGLPLDQKYNMLQNQGKLILRKISKRYKQKNSYSYVLHWWHPL